MTRQWFRTKDGRPRVAGTLFNDAVTMLEERVMLDAVPTVSVDAPATVLLKAPSSSFDVHLTFDNTGSTPGFGPYIELTVPKNGYDGAGAPAQAVTTADDDGITFNGATYLGSTVTEITAPNTVFDIAGHATNPLTGDVVNGNPGDQFVVLRLPFGSYTGAQTPADIVANFLLSPKADLGTPMLPKDLTIIARAGFQYGNDALDNPMGPPMNDPRIVGLTAMDTFTPVLATLTKVSNAPSDREQEVGTGPNQPLIYTINVDVADGQTLTNVDVTDLLPDTIHFTSASITIGSGTITATPTNGAGELAINPLANTLNAHFNSITGVAGPDAQITVQFYVAGMKFDGVTPVINPTTGTTTFTDNNVTLTGSWQPLDTNDPLTMFTLDPAGFENRIENQPIVIQKTSTIAVDNGPAGLNPGDVIEYTLNIQVSDYFTVGDISLNDVLSDGQRLDTSFIPVLVVNERGDVRATGSMTGVTVGAAAPGDTTTGNEFAGNFVSTFNAATGVTVSTINISQALIDAGALSFLGAPGVVSGGRVVSSDTGSTIQVRFRAIVQNNFESNALAATDQAVDQGDAVGNDVTLSGSIRDNTTGGTTLNATSAIDDATEALPIQRGSLIKTVYAVTSGGVTTLNPASVQLKAGDLITYRLEFNLPISAFQSLSFADFLPLPVLVAQDLAAVVNAPAFTAGELAYGPTDTFHTLVGAPAPDDMFDTSGNSITLSYPNYALQDQAGNPPNQVSKIDLLFTLVVRDTNFADGLFLTNLATSSESGTVNSAAGNSIVQFQLAQPNLLIQKAIVSATSAGGAKGTILPAVNVPGLDFGVAGTASGPTGLSGATPLTDTRLGITVPKGTVAAPNINSNLTGVDAGDIARVALVINNEGGNDAFDVVFGDTLAAGTVFAGGTIDNAGSHLVVTRGDGTVLGAVNYTITSTATSFAITLANDVGGHSALGKDGVTDGTDILVVTYDIALANSVAITPTALTSNASVTNYAALAGGIDQSFTDPFDAATIGVLTPTVSKTLISTSEDSTTGANLTIGETAVYRVTYTLPEGTISAAKFLDILPIGPGGRYEVLGASFFSIGAGLTSDGATQLAAGDFGAFVAANQSGGDTFNERGGFTGNGTIGGPGITIVSLGDNAPNNTVVIEFTVRAVDDAVNIAGVTGSNEGRLIYGPGGILVQDFKPIGIALPNLVIDKQELMPAASYDAGDTVHYSITVSNPNPVTAYDLSLADIVGPAGLLTNFQNIVVTGNVTEQGVGTVAASGVISMSNAGVITITANTYALLTGQTFTITFDADIAAGAQAGQIITNTGQVGYSTLAGDQGAVDREISKPDAAPITIAATAIDKFINTTSVGNDTSSTVVIGETVTFDMRVTLAEGITNSFSITDALPSGMVFVSGEVISIGANITGSMLTVGAGPTTPGMTSIFSFGNLSDSVNNMTQTPADQIVVRIVGRVADVVGNATGTVLTNIGTASSLVGGVTVSRSDTEAVTVAVPDLLITKTRVGSGTPDAGDTVTFTVDVRNNSTTGAFDLALNDQLPSGLDTLTVTNLSTNIGTLTTANFATTSNILTLTGGTLDMAPSQFFTVTVTGRVTDAAVTGALITNKADIRFSTLSGSDANERTINPTFSEIASPHTSSASVTPSNVQSIVKTILESDTSVASTGSARIGVGPDLVPGETGVFRIVVTLPEGTTNNVVIGDILQNAGGRLELVGVPAVTLGAPVGPSFTPISFTGLGTFAAGADGNGDGLPDSFSYNFGNVTVPGDNSTGNNTITITYTARLRDVAENVAGATSTTAATLNSGLGAATSPTVSYDIVQPLVSITKDVNAFTTRASGDTVQYTSVITAVDNGTTSVNAQDVVFTDALGGGAVLSGTTVRIDGVDFTVGGPAIGGVSVVASGSGFSVRFGEMTTALGANHRHELVYNAAVSTGAGATVNNNATITYDAIASIGGVSTTDGQSDRNLGDGNDAPLGTINITKAIVATSLLTDTGTVKGGPGRGAVPDLAIGETATFQLTINVPAGGGQARTFTVGDLLDMAGVGRLTLFGGVGGVTITEDPSVTYATAPVKTLPDLDADGNPDLSIAFSIAAGSGAGTITVTYVATAANVAANTAGDQINLPVVLAYSAPTSGVAGTIGRAVDVDIVEPVLAITKDVVVAGTPDAGDTATYTVVVTNVDGDTAGPAYNVALIDLLPTGLTLSGNASIVYSLGGTPNTNVSTLAGLTLDRLLVGETATITYTATIANSVLTGSPVRNDATATAQSLPAVGTGRTGPTVTDFATFTTAGVRILDKTITANDNLDTGTGTYFSGYPDLTIGEIATVTLKATLSEGTTNTVVLSDALASPAGRLTYIDGSEVISSNVSFTGTITRVLIDDDGDTIADRVEFRLGNVTLPSDADPANNFFTVTYRAAAGNRSENQAGDVLNLTATLNTAIGAASPVTMGVDIVAPALSISKTTPAGLHDAGDTVIYTITARNSGSGPAYSLVLTDTLPGNVSFVTGSATLVVGGIAQANPAGVSTVTLTPPLLPGQTAVLTYNAIIGDAMVAGAPLDNVVKLNADSLPGAAIGRPETQIMANVVIPTAGVQILGKTITADDNLDTGTGRYFAGYPDLTIGEAATVALRVTLSEGTTTAVVLGDALTTAQGTLTYVSGSASVTTSNGAAFTGSIVPMLIDDNADGIPDRIQFTLGDVTLPGDNNGGNNFFIVTYRAVAADRSENAAGDILTLTATLNSALGAAAPAAAGVDIVEPALSITKTTPAGAHSAGDIVTYSVTVVNAAGSGPAYNIALTDELPADVSFVAGTAALTVGGVAQASPGTIGTVTIDQLLPGQTAVLTYNALIGDAIVTGTSLNNVVTLTSDSLPGAPVGRAGPVLPANVVIPTAATQLLDKTITADDNLDTGANTFAPGPDLAVGEVAAIGLRVTLSEGTTNAVVLGDALTSAAGTLTYVPGSATISTANGVVITGSVIPALIDDNADGIPDRIVFTLGNVTLPGNNAAGDDFFIVTYRAVAGDRAENQVGDVIDLTATLDSALGAAAPVSRGVDIVAPMLGIDKTFTTSDPTPNAGDTVTYRIVVSNNGSGPAYGVVLNDPLPAGLTYVPGSATLVLDLGGGTSSPGAPNSVTVGRLLAGQTATLTYQVTIDNSAVTGVPIVNTASVAPGSTSSPGGVGRLGTTPSDSEMFVVQSLQDLTKTISATSDAATGTGAFRPIVTDLHIGETATFDLTVQLTEGSTGNVVVTDTLLTSMGTLTLVGSPTIVTTNGITFIGTGTAGFTLIDANMDGIPEGIRFDFGTVTVPGNNITSDNFFVIRYTAVVGDRPENQAGDMLDLAATLKSDLSPAAVTRSVGVDIVAPSVVLTKSANAGFVSRGDTVLYTISLMNNGTGPAYDLSLGDVLPSGLSYSGTTTLTVGGVTTTFASPNAVILAMLGAGQTATVNYQVLVDPNVAASASYTNTATVGYDSLSGPGGRTGTTSGMATITTPTNVLGLSKAIITTTVPETGTAMFRPGVADLTIGERATIDLTASFTEGATATVVLTDQLPLTGKFQIVGTPTITFLGGVTTTLAGTPTLVDSDGDGLADRITFNFGTVTVPVDGDPTNNLIRVRYDIVVPDVAVNAPGAALDSPALLTSAAGTVNAGILADIVAPNITIAKAVSAGTPDAGDIKTYTITLTNNGSGPGFDLLIADTLPTGLTAVAGTTVLTIGGTSTTFASPNAVPVASLGVGQSAVLTFNAVVGDGVVGGSTLTNSATVSYDSLPGPGGHPGDATSSVGFTTAAVQTLDKTVVATSETFTGTAAVRPGVTDLTIGETATIQLATTFNEGTTANVVITDQLVTASGLLTLTGTPSLVLGAGITITGSVTPQLIDTNGDGIPDQVRFVLGTVVVPGDNNPADNSITIRYDAVLADVPRNASGNQVTVAATLDSSIGSLTDSELLDIVSPIVTISKAVPGATVDAGDIKSYTVTVINSGIGPAFDLTIADPLPAGLTAVTGSTVLTIGGVSTSFASPGAVTLASLDAGQTAVVTFQARVDDSVVGGSTLTNTASVSYDSVGGPGGHTGTASASANFTTAAVQTLDKTVVATSETFTGTQAFRPGATDLTLGERATFELATTFSEGTTANVVITDQLVTANGVLTFTGTPTLGLGAGITISGSVTPQLIDTNGDGVPDQVRFVLGTVTVPGDNNPANNFVRIRYDAVVANVPGNISGNQLALPATLISSSGSLGDSEPVDLVAPTLVLQKVFAPDQPADGQTTAFLLTIAHAAGSTAAATNIVLTEVLPAGALLAGATIVGAPAGIVINGNVITVPLLAIGETVTIRISTSVNFTAPPSGDTINTATLSSGTVTAGTPGGRIVTASAQAILPFGNPTTTLPGALGLQEQTELSSMGYYLDERYIENFPEIDPVYSGSAAPGTSVTIDVSDETGSASGFGTGIADAGGNWLVRLPSTTVSDRLQHSRFEHHYDGSRLFRSPTSNLFEDRSLLGFNRLGDRLSVGSKPAYNTQIVRISVGGTAGGFDTSFAPAWRDQFFSMEPELSIQGVFRDRAGSAVEGLYERLDSPEAAGLNRFNREFLTTADF